MELYVKIKMNYIVNGVCGVVGGWVGSVGLGVREFFWLWWRVVMVDFFLFCEVCCVEFFVMMFFLFFLLFWLFDFFLLRFFFLLFFCFDVCLVLLDLVDLFVCMEYLWVNIFFFFLVLFGKCRVCGFDFESVLWFFLLEFEVVLVWVFSLWCMRFLREE